MKANRSISHSELPSDSPTAPTEAQTAFRSTYRNCPHDPVHEWLERGDCIAESNKDTRKHVFSTGEIPHLWAHKVQSDGRNSQRNLYFENETIFSYGRHFPIARHVKNSRHAAIMFTTGSYSNTTAGHIHSVRMAIPSAVTVFNVAEVLADSKQSHESNLADYLRRIDKALVVCSRARSSYRKESEHESAETLRAEAKAYARFFNVACPKLPTIPALDSDGMAAIKRRESDRQAKEAEATKRRKAEEIRAEAERIDRWRAGENVGSLWNVPVMLRIRTFGADADVAHAVAQVETSRGARVPVSHAIKALAFVRSVRESGQEFVTNGHTFHIGEYRLDWIEANGTLHAGCHHIPYSEIERIAPELEKIQAEAL